MLQTLNLLLTDNFQMSTVTIFFCNCQSHNTLGKHYRSLPTSVTWESTEATQFTGGDFKIGSQTQFRIRLTEMKPLLEKSSLKLIHMHIFSWAWALTQSVCDCRWEGLLVLLVVAAVKGLWELPDERKNDDSLRICKNLGDCHK